MKGYKELSADAVTGITLLSVEEYKAAQEYIPLLDDWWWLRSPGHNSDLAAYVFNDGSFGAFGLYVRNGVAVRPALRIDPESFNLQIGDGFRFGGKAWTYIAEGLALSDGAFCEMPFREDWKAEDANVYEASDVKVYLDGWLRDATRGTKADWIPVDSKTLPKTNCETLITVGGDNTLLRTKNDKAEILIGG